MVIFGVSVINCVPFIRSCFIREGSSVSAYKRKMLCVYKVQKLSVYKVCPFIWFAKLSAYKVQKINIFELHRKFLTGTL